MSKQLDHTLCGQQPCLRALVVVVVKFTWEALKITLFQSTIVYSTYRRSGLLCHSSLSLLRPSQVQVFHLLFLENPQIPLASGLALNPVTLLPTSHYQGHSHCQQPPYNQAPGDPPTPDRVTIIHSKGHKTSLGPVTMGASRADTMAQELASSFTGSTGHILFLAASIRPNNNRRRETHSSIKGPQKGWMVLFEQPPILPQNQALSIISEIYQTQYIRPKALLYSRASL